MSLVGWWKLEGDATDSLGNYDGYEQGSPSYSSGKIGNCYDNTGGGSNGIELIRHDDFKQFEAYYSFSLWFKSTTTSGGGGERLISRDASEYPTVIVRQDESSPQNFRFYEATETDTTTVSVNEWHHMAFTIDKEANESQIFIDGELVGTGGVNGSTLSRPYVLGGNTEGDGDITGSHFKGKIDDVRLYDHKLSQKEVKQLSRAKVLHYKFDNDGLANDSSGYGNDGTLNSVTYTQDNKIGSGTYDFSSSGGVVASNNSILQIVGNLTISFWAKPFDIDSPSRQNPIHKDYQDEYTMTMETSGNLSFYFNDSDSNYNNYQVSNMFRNDNEWVHVTAVRDMNAGEVRWYRNGSLYDTQGLSGGDPVAGGNNVQIGDGYTNPFNGILDDFRIYASALTETEVKQIYKQRASIDSGGNLHAHEYQETKYDGLIADHTVWEVGTTGSQGSFSRNGNTSENEIVEMADPFGKTVPVWKCIPDSNSDADGGWNMSFTGDNSDRLRMTVFVKRTGNTNGSTYHGCDNGGNTLNLDGTSNGNPYFWSGNPPSLNDWYLLVGVVHPNSYTGGDMGIAGVYDMDGNKVIDGTEYKWGTGNTQELRDYLFYCTDTSERQYFVYPRVDVMDGTEPTIDGLVSGLDSRNHDYLQNIDTSEPQPMAIHPDKTFVSGINEKGPGADSLVGHWKLDGDTKDYSGNGNHGTSNGATVTSGLGQSAYDFQRSNNDYINIGTVGSDFAVGRGDFTFSAWVKFDTFSTNGTIFELSRYTDALLVRPDDGDWTIYMDNDANDRYFANPISASTGEWVHFLITRRNGTVEMYEDAQSLGTNNMDGKFEINQDSYIGMSVHSTGQAHDGKIQDVRFFNRALTAEEIKTLYNLTDPRQNQRVVQSSSGEVYSKGEFNELL